MIIFQTAKKGIELSFEEDEVLQLCPRCGTPNKLSVGYCIDCQGLLQTPKDGRDCKVKAYEVIKCPKCGRYNIDGALACANKACGFRFSDHITTEDTPPAPKAVYVKLCPQCQHKNPAATDVCERCGTDISLVVETEPAPRYTLFNLTTHQNVLLCDTEHQTIGKDCFLREQMINCNYVSHTHADIFCRNGQWLIRDRSRNGTYLKGKRIEKEVDVALEPGIIISLGDPSPDQTLAAHFRFDCHAD